MDTLFATDPHVGSPTVRDGRGESPYARVTTLRRPRRAVHTTAVAVRHELVSA